MGVTPKQEDLYIYKLLYSHVVSLVFDADSRVSMALGSFEEGERSAPHPDHCAVLAHLRVASPYVTVPFLVAASTTPPYGFVRVENRSEVSSPVEITAVDDTGARFGPVALALAQARLRDKLLAEYSLAIRAAVERNWLRPPGAPAQLSCTERVSQAPSGDVVTVEIVESSGNRTFDNSVENAVWKSSPLPLPEDPSLFSRNLHFVFDPGR